MDLTTDIPSPIRSEITLTPSQEKCVSESFILLTKFNFIFVKGESQSGKYTALLEMFNRYRYSYRIFDLCYLAGQYKEEISNQHIFSYLNKLKDELLTSGSRRELGKRIYDDFGHQGIIYIRYYNYVYDILTDCFSKLRFLLPLVIKTFLTTLPPNIKIVVSTTGYRMDDPLHWCVDLNTTKEDMAFILRKFDLREDISIILFNMMRIIPVGKLIHCINYALFYANEKDLFIEKFKIGLSKQSGSTLDVEKDVDDPASELIGMEGIIDELRTSIIIPMSINIPNVHMKKGVLLCGPPGTGKTSIGRWLAHEIKGKFYLVTGNNDTLTDNFSATLHKAKENKPAVIFIDDCDTLFTDLSTYRSFLIKLDGIENRHDICVILTCMNMKTIPASLIRGGRLELSLITSLPRVEHIKIVLQIGFNKIIVINPAVCYSSNFIDLVSVKMIGWNYADINRCIEDVIRLIIAGKGLDLDGLFEISIRKIRQQYEFCAPCESTSTTNSVPYIY